MSLVAQKLISASGPKEATDDDFNLVTQLYQFDGSNGAQNNTLLDSSSESHTVTRNADIVQGTFSPFSAEEGKWGVLFEADDSDYLTLSNSDFAFGTGDFTAECFIFLTGNGEYSGGIFQANGGSGGAAPALAQRDTTGLTIYSSSGQKITGNNGTLQLGVWYHLALVRASGVIRVYKDGALVTWSDGTTTAADTTNVTNSTFVIGKYYSNSYTMDGFISNFRVTGSAVYTGAFTKPTTPLTDITNTVLLTCRDNRFMDASSEANTVSIGAGTPKIQPFSPFAPSAEYDASTMGGSGYFVRTNNDSISLTDSSLAIGNGDFTIEGWYYFDGDNSSSVGLFQQDNGVNAPAIGWWPANTNGFQIYYGASGTWTGTTNSGIRMFEWIHIAFVRSSGTIKVYVNGVSKAGSISDTTNYTSTNFKIGQYYSTGYGMEGYISNFKMCLNAIYTSAFTPPTALVTPTSGGSSAASTKILVNFTDAAIIDSSRKTNVLTVGNAQLDTSVKKFGTASAEFDNSGDYLTIPTSSFIPLGGGNFTIECFVRFSTAASSGIFQLSNGTLNSTTRGPAAGCSSSTGKWGIYHGTTWLEHGSLVPSATTWYHVAFVRNSGTSKFYVDGTEILSVSDTTNYTDTYFTIGGWYSTSYLMDGYIDEFRISLKARYTSNFTAPTKAFPNS